MARMSIARNPKIREKIMMAVREGKIVIVAQKDLTRIVKPGDPDRVVFVAREEA